ncbi:MAG: type III pantothenate kinase [Myxococcota bacterium]|nr:type III pantothenate kinase [Myxococcota bacterium]
MLLVIDVGNTNTVLALLDGERVRTTWRVSSAFSTTDEVGLQLVQLLALKGHDKSEVRGVIISCVVPEVLYALEKASHRYLDLQPLVVGKGLKTGMRVRTDNPREVGSDRIVNCVAALDKWPAPLVVVDFGTATTFDCVNTDGDYVGGAIAPGLQISVEALFQKTSKLPHISIRKPQNAIGTNTISAMQSGVFWGYVGLVDGLVERCSQELGGQVTCVATGGLSNLVGRACTSVEHISPNLTLQGLRLLYERNKR